MMLLKRIYVLEESNKREEADAMMLLEEMNAFFRRTSIDIYTLEKAIAADDVATVKSLRRYFGFLAERTAPEDVRGLKRSTCIVLCDILDVYLNDHEKRR